MQQVAALQHARRVDAELEVVLDADELLERAHFGPLAPVEDVVLGDVGESALHQDALDRVLHVLDARRPPGEVLCEVLDHLVGQLVRDAAVQLAHGAERLEDSSRDLALLERLQPAVALLDLCYPCAMSHLQPEIHVACRACRSGLASQTGSICSAYAP